MHKTLGARPTAFLRWGDYMEIALGGKSRDCLRVQALISLILPRPNLPDAAFLPARRYRLRIVYRLSELDHVAIRANYPPIIAILVRYPLDKLGREWIFNQALFSLGIAARLRIGCKRAAYCLNEGQTTPAGRSTSVPMIVVQKRAVVVATAQLRVTALPGITAKSPS